MIKALFILNLKALATNFVKTGKKEYGAGMKIFIAVIAIFVAASLISTFGALFHSLLDPFFSAGIGWMYFATLAVMVFGWCVLSTIYTASAQLFGAKDNELLLSMPIKTSTILISRLLVVLVLEYAFTLICSLPAFFIWLNGGYATILGILFFITGILLLPLMSMAVSLLLAWIVGAVTSRLRHKNIITLALSVGFLFIYLYGVSNLQGYLNKLLDNGEQLANAFRKSLPPFYALGISISEADFSNWLIFTLWTIIPFTAAIALLSVNYRKVLITNRGSSKIKYKEKTTKAGNAFIALVRKEMAHYWSKPFVILNSSMGSLAMLAVAVAVIVKKSEILLYVNELTPIFSALSPAALMAIGLTVLNTANNISASLISLEGKNLWIVKSIPVPPSLIIQAKACTHLLISGLPCLVASVCMAIMFAGSTADLLLIILLPQAFGVLIAVGGIAINLHFPKLEWTNEIYVVKQGLSSIVTMLSAMTVVAGLVFAYIFLLADTISLTAFLWFCTAVFAVGAAAVYAWLMKSGADMFTKL